MTEQKPTKEPTLRIRELFDEARASLRKSEGMRAVAIAYSLINNFKKVYGLHDDYAYDVLNSEAQGGRN
jgi:hypothetical protein